MSLTFLGRPVAARVYARLVVLAPGEQRPYRPGEWRDALVVVERGAIELECVGGGRRRFSRGAVLFLAGLPLRALQNPTDEPALLSAVTRQLTTERGEPMHTVTSADGTTIAYDRIGDGPPVVTLAGVFNDRQTTAPLAAALQDRFTVLNPDRRGRGDSGDTPPYAVEREIEDIGALIEAAGGQAAVFGYSSGAMLALKAAGHGLPITKLALYDAPYVVDDTRPLLPAGFHDELAQLIADGRRGEAVELYQRVVIGIPEPVVVQMREAPFRPGLEAIAHTLVYEATLVGDLSLPEEEIATVETPTLVVFGEDGPPIMAPAADALVRTLPNAQRRALAGQTHDIAPDVLGPVLTEFLG